MDLCHVLDLTRRLIDWELIVLLREKDLSEFLEREYPVLLNVMHFENLLDFSISKGLASLRKGLPKVCRCDVTAVVCIEVLKESQQLLLGKYSIEFNCSREEL